MKKLLVICLCIVGLFMSLVFTCTVQAEPAFGREHHPEIHEALHALERAKDHLQKADHDFGGHREAALQACDAAIEQLRIALRFER